MATFASRGPLEGCEPFARGEASREEEEQSLGARFKPGRSVQIGAGPVDQRSSPLQ